MAVAFGRAIAERAPKPLDWAWPVSMAFRRAQEEERSGDLAIGYYIGLAAREPKAVSSFKRAALRSRIFARLAPPISLAVGINAEDVELVRASLKSGVLPVSSLDCSATGGVLATLPPEVVAPLFSDLLSGTPRAWNVAVNLMGMYAFGDPSRLDRLGPQIRLLAETSGVQAPHSSNHHFGRIATWMLKRGRDDEDARAVALSLTRVLVAHVEAGGFVGNRRLAQLIPILLEDYPEAWSFISKAIVANPKLAWQFMFALSDRNAVGGGKTSVLLNLPHDPLFAWCQTYPEVGPAFLAAIDAVAEGSQWAAPGHHSSLGRVWRPG
jgi:hypothetical protein